MQEPAQARFDVCRADRRPRLLDLRQTRAMIAPVCALSPRSKKECPDMTQASQRTRFTAGPLTFIVKHELWDGNIHDHADQGVSIDVAADVAGKETTLLRFNCFDQEK